MNKIKTWVDANPKKRWVKILFLYLVIAFAIGLIMKLVASSLATANYVSLSNRRDNMASQIVSAIAGGAPANQIAGMKIGLAQLTQGAIDQSIGVYVGWSMIALKLYIYITTFITLYKMIYKECEVSQKWLWFMFARFFTLIIGLSVGEGLTIYFTERNKHGESLTGQQIFSYISPAMSILFAIAAPPLIFQVIKNNSKTN